MKHYTVKDANINSAANRLDTASRQTPREVGIRMLKRSLAALAAAGMSWTPGYTELEAKLEELENV